MKKPILKAVILSFLMMFSWQGLAAQFAEMFQNNQTIWPAFMDRAVSLEAEGLSLEEALKQIATEGGVTLSYAEGLLDNEKPVTVMFEKQPLYEAFRLILEESSIEFSALGGGYIVLRKKPGSGNSENTTGSIEGRVIDARTNEPLPGASVYLEGTTIGTSTGKEGLYELKNLDVGRYKIVASFIGYERQEKIITIFDDETKTVEFELVITPGALNEVVVIGYGTASRRELTGSVARVTAEEVRKQPVTNPLHAMQGRMAGVAISSGSGAPGSPVEIQIRGINSIAAGRQPLFVVDGVPMTSASLSPFGTTSGIGTTGALSPFNSINTSDIESIEVLKDADATAIYGSRGSNGVVLITTRKASVTGGTQLDIDYYTGFSQASSIVPTLNTRDYLTVRQDDFAARGADPTEATAPELMVWDQQAYTDWADYVYGNIAPVHNVQARLSGGEGRTRYLLGGGYSNQEAITPGGQLEERISAHTNVQHRSANEKFQGSFSANYSIYNLEGSGATETHGQMSMGLTMPPNYSAYTDEGDLHWINGTVNPIAALNNTSLHEAHNLVGSSDLRYTFLPGFEAQMALSYNRQLLDIEILRPASSIGPQSSALNSSRFASSVYQAVNLEPQLRYSTVVSGGRLQTLLGGAWYRNVREQKTIFLQDFASDALLRNWGASTISTPSATSAHYHYQSVFARLNYNFMDRYIVNASFRRDGSSRFGLDRRWGNFGAVGGAWLFSREGFISDNLSFLSHGKLRGSFGVTGNDDIGNYQYMELYGSISESSGYYPGSTKLAPSVLPNPEYGWEHNRKLEVAMELGFFADRLLITTAWYRNRSDDLLIYENISGQTGFSSYQANFPALVENRGWEIEFSSQVGKSSLVWLSSLNVSWVRNQLVEFHDIENYFYASNYQIGQPLTRVQALIFERIDPETGLPVFTDINGDGIINITNDRGYVGSPSPRFFGGFSNIIRYRNIELDVFFQFSRQLATNWKSGINSFMSQSNLPEYVKGNYWKAPGDVTDLPRLGAIGQTFWFFSNSSAAYDDVLYARLKNLSLSYTLPSAWAGAARMQRARLFIQGQNLFTITSVDLGKDPELRNWYTTPIPRIWTAGIQLSF